MLRGHGELGAEWALEAQVQVWCRHRYRYRSVTAVSSPSDMQDLSASPFGSSIIQLRAPTNLFASLWAILMQTIAVWVYY